jgi:methionyl-tRNA formyltransferase
MVSNNKSLAFLFSKSNNWITEFVNLKTLESIWEGPIDFFFDEEEVTGYEIVFILGYTKILDDNFLSRNGLNLVVHESALPYGKGFSPVQWQILAGSNEVVVTLLEASNSIDGGDILLQRTLFFDGLELYDEIREKQATATILIIREFLTKFPMFKKSKQVGREVVFRRRRPEDNRLCLDKTIRDQFNLFRIGNNDGWPSYFIFQGSKYIIKIYKDKE